MPKPGEQPPPLYKPELIEPKKRLTLMQRCYKEPWVPIGALLPTGRRECRLFSQPFPSLCPTQAA